MSDARAAIGGRAGADAGALPLVGVLAQLASGEISASHAVEIYLDRIDRIDRRIGAFITVTGELAREQATAADRALADGHRLGPLHGLPIALKDNIDTAGIRTTVGSAFFAQQLPTHDAEVAARMHAAGAIVLGKVTLHEFAYGVTNQNPHHGACRNAWDAERIPGGSSGGSAAAVAAGLCALALGTDTGGSVRIPAALNGVSALRPTYGRVSNRGVFPVSWSFDTVGPIAHGVDDLAAALAVLAGFDAGDVCSVDHPVDDYRAAVDIGVEGLRIGLPRDFFFDDVDSEIVNAVRSAAECFATLGAAVHEVNLPSSEAAVRTTQQLIRAEAYAVHRERLAQTPDGFGEDVARRLELGREIGGAEYAAGRQLGRVWERLVEEAFDEVDVLLSPVTAATAPFADVEMISATAHLTRLTYGWTLAGLPALAIPCGFTTASMPIGLQLAAARFCESTLIAAGAAFQRATDWHLHVPPVARADH